MTDSDGTSVRTFHRWFGLALVVTFVLTGQYMDKVLAHLHGMAAGPHLLYRSRHIYVLMAALLHLALGAYAIRPASQGARVAQVAGSTLLTLGSALLVFAFFYDPRHADLVPLDLVYSKFGIYMLAAGTVLHAVTAGRGRGARAAERPPADLERVS
jgi:hypothetical protein